MPFFTNMPNHQPTIAPISITSTSQPLAIVPIVSTSSNELGLLKALMQNIGKKLQDQEKKMEDNFLVVKKMRNELVTLKRQKAQRNRPPQPHYQGPIYNRPPNPSQGYAPHNQNRRIGNAPANTSTNPSKALVP